MKEPNNLDEVVDMLIAEIDQQKATEHVKSEGIAHHGAGTSIRNSLKLWWHPSWTDSVVDENGSIKEVQSPKPPLVQWFNDKNIYHADDMSGTISEAIQARLKGKPFNVDEHIKRYFKHWKKYGYKDGIFKPENVE